MTDPIRIAIVDADPIFRSGFINAFGHNELLELVGEGATGPDAIRIVDEQQPDVVLLDIGLPGGTIEALRVIRNSWPAVKIIMLANHSSSENLEQVFAAGARAYVRKGISAAEFVPIFRTVQRGDIYVTPTILPRWLDQSKRDSGDSAQEFGIRDLTDRERQILDHVSRGLTNKEVARILDVSDKTVKFHMTTIMEKLHVRNRVEAAMCCYKSSSQTNTDTVDRRFFAWNPHTG